MIQRVISLVLLIFIFNAGTALANDKDNACTKLLLGSLGEKTHPISTQISKAQDYFDKGMALAFGFNHAEAAKAFTKATDLDPNCAICYWGLAYVLGPNINAPMDDSVVPTAYAAVQKALELSTNVNPREKAYIKAISKRYAAKPMPDRKALDKAYADEMRTVHKSFPHDPDAAVLFAESLMNLSPWDYWEEDGKPKNAILEILAALKSAIKMDPDHPHANHLYIHSVEASKTPEDGVPSADRLGNLVPGAGHLVHMPGHIYIRTGDYHKAVIANERAIKADDAYQSTCTPEGIYPLAYMPHNHHFLWASYTWEGNGQNAIRSSRELVKRVNDKMMRKPGFGTLQHFWATPMFAMARFARWKDILIEPKPPTDLKYPIGVWHHVRGMAYIAQNDIENAKQELANLESIIADPSVDSVKIWGMNKVTNLLKIGQHLLAGKIQENQGNMQDAIKEYKLGVQIEDDLYYDEPHSWYYPMRQSLGYAMLKTGDTSAAEKNFMEDLERHRKNGWSLHGLLQTARAQGDNKKIKDLEQRFKQAWQHSDLDLK